MELKGRLQGLEWLIEEVEASLHLAYEALESYLADSSDEAQIRYCLSYLHQIHGSLKIVECHGPLLLAEEMESLAESMLEQHVSNIEDACDVMVLAILKLPAYLRQVMVSRRDQPETLLLLLNDLRAVRGEHLVSETVFFSPKMDAAQNLSTPYNRKPDQIAMSNLLRKLRQMYQFALAGVVKDETVGENFGYLDKVFSRLKELSKGFPREPLWTAVLALLEGISAKEIPLGYSVRKLLQELDGEIDQLAKMGFEGLSQPLPEALLKNLLFYIAYARSDAPRAVQVRTEYGLDDSLPETLLEDSGEGLSPIYYPETAASIESTADIDQSPEADAENVVSEGNADPSNDKAGMDAKDIQSEPNAGESEALPQVMIEPLDRADVDLDILETFISEADELLEEIDQALQGWEQNWSSKDHVEALKRSLHTLKGGARMAGMEQLGTLSHDLETEVTILETKPGQLNKGIFQGLLRQQYYLLESLNLARKLFDDSDEQPDLPVSDTTTEEGLQPEPSAEEAPAGTELIMQTVLPHVVDETSEAQFKPNAAALSMPDIKRQSQPQEMTKVPAALLESLVNLAGETSISRGRVEQHVSEFAFTLDEMESTIQRLKDQIRRIGMETEAQVMFRQEQLEAMSVAEGFDPLEMDRYSQLQQLSRSLLESSSDLQDLKNTLVDKSRGADAELLAQSRINTDLQEQLMQSRMVPFLRIVPRLRRMVRQLSNELGKNVEFYLVNVEGEMDRAVMEQMLPPLEHMIRNSIDHGIEPEDERRNAGKSEAGAISIGLVREGGDIVIQIADDGRGLNIESIRRRAIEMGLMAEDSDFSDQEIIQFIFQPGFSTTEEVTQVSGRGVGMDAVNSQVRELGGFVQIVTRKGEGTQFSIRLPFTVSVNRALMIDIGEDRYALPLNSVDGVVRVSSMELEHYYRFPDARLEYAGGRYEVRYLGSLLSEELTPKVDMSVESVFLVLVHSETRLYAVQVDRLAGSSEIVVKSLGPQFSKVPGLSGATSLGDGRVVVILDLLALLRAQVTAKPGVEVLDSREESSQSDAPTVMVVDDSVTVRKVASRFLEREGFKVVTARDGVEAMQLLQENQPDIMLLDIEMPRMDGFEVARRVKESEELKNIPIIMITSRTGEKHREHAVGLGVEGYLGKPYQEEELLEAMTTFMNLVEQEESSSS